MNPRSGRVRHILGCEIKFKPKRDILLEDTVLIQLPLSIMILQPLSPYLI
jgi:hypothetical protein